jgi:outer membrane protein
MKGTVMARGGWGSCVIVFLVAVFACAVCAPFAATEETAAPATPAPTENAAVCPPGAQAGVAAAQPSVESTGAITLGVSQAILMALENNKALVVQRYNPSIQYNGIAVQRAAFDPDLTARATYSKSTQNQPTVKGLVRALSEGERYQVALSEFLPTGTTVALSGTTAVNPKGPDVAEYSTRAGVDVTQSLLRGFGIDVNLASLRQARIAYLASEYELRGFSENLLAQTEETYWNYALAQQQIVIFEQSLKIAEDQMNETKERIRVGQLAESELAAAAAEVALRRQNLINARAALATTRVQLLRLISPQNSTPLGLDVVTSDQPCIPTDNIDGLDEHIELALRMRPDLNQARLQVNSGDLQVIKTKNGLLPQLDLFATFGKTGFSDSYWGSIRHIDDGGYDLLVGLQGEYPLGNRAAKANYSSSVLSRDEALESVANLAELVEEDIRLAFIEVGRSGEQVTASAATTKLQEETLRAETEKFRVGRSTNLLVIQAQRDLLQAQITEIQSVISYIKSFTELYRLEGSLLTRRGIQCAGNEPVTMTSGLGAAKAPGNACTVTAPAAMPVTK